MHAILLAYRVFSPLYLVEELNETSSGSSFHDFYGVDRPIPLYL